MTELESLECENKELRSQIDRLNDEFKLCTRNLEQSRKTISEKNAQIKFLEGQVEAYQYCMNCRR